MKILFFIFLTMFVVACHSTTSDLSPIIQQKIELPIDKIIKDSEASFEKNKKNSGVLDFISDQGWLITKNAANRYNNLIKKYSESLDNPIPVNFGLTELGENFIMTQEAMIKFALLNQIHKSNTQ